jgi:hypothetical protein
MRLNISKLLNQYFLRLNQSTAKSTFSHDHFRIFNSWKI